MAARFTWQVLGVLFIVCGLFGKVGAVLTIIPEPVIGALIVVGLGMVITVALSNVHLIDMRVPRNLMILGIAMMLGMMLPPWVKGHPGVIKTGRGGPICYRNVYTWPSTTMLICCINPIYRLNNIVYVGHQTLLFYSYIYVYMTTVLI